jgi:hypothetical protein
MEGEIKAHVIFLSERDTKYIESVEKLHAQTSWGDRWDQNKDLFSRNYMSEMRPCSTTDRQIGSE